MFQFPFMKVSISIKPYANYWTPNPMPAKPLFTTPLKKKKPESMQDLETLNWEVK